MWGDNSLAALGTMLVYSCRRKSYAVVVVDWDA